MSNEPRLGVDMAASFPPFRAGGRSAAALVGYRLLAPAGPQLGDELLPGILPQQADLDLFPDLGAALPARDLLDHGVNPGAVLPGVADAGGQEDVLEVSEVA